MAGVVAIGAVGAVASDGEPATSSADSSNDAGEQDRADERDEPDTESSSVDDSEGEVEPVAAEPSSTPAPTEPKTFRVSSVTDGDTLVLSNGESVRLVGIDAPETGDCGSIRAEEMLAELTLGKRVTLETPVRDRDKYDRLLRYVDIGTVDAGMRLIKRGLAIARYDSRDGYERHARQPSYVRADAASPAVVCAPPPADPVPFAGGGSNCAPGYSPCIASYPPDLDCADTGPVTVTGPDPHGLDADGDGVACGGD